MAEPAVPYAYNFLTGAEARFLDAAVERLIPADELGPGAKEAGVTYYIDQQLKGMWGTHGRQYRSGPWFEGTPQQGWQSRFTPQELYRVGIHEINEYCVKTHGKIFEFLSADLRDQVLHALEEGGIDLPSLSSKLFFDTLWRNTEEGFFADPLYGGNAGKVGWKLLGFPGVGGSDYNDHLDKSEPYRVKEPVSIVDIEQLRAKLDPQGFPKHDKLGK